MPINPVDPSQQAAVSGQFTQPPAGGSIGEVLAKLIAFRQQEQAKVTQAFEIIARGNPALAQFLAAQPGFTEALTATPTLRGPSPGKIAAKALESGTQAFTAEQAKKGGGLELTGTQQSQLAQDVLNDLTDEALKDDEAVKTYLTSRLSADPAVVQKAVTTLAHQGAFRRAAGEQGTLGLIKSIIDNKEQFKGAAGNPLIRPGREFADAFTLARQPGVDEIVRQINTQRLQELLTKDVLGPDDLIKIDDQIADAQEQIRFAEERKAAAKKTGDQLRKIAALAGGDVAALEKQVLPGGESADAVVAAADEEIARRKEQIAALEALKARGTKAKPKKGERAAETPEQRKKRLRELIPK